MLHHGKAATYSSLLTQPVVGAGGTPILAASLHRLHTRSLSLMKHQAAASVGTDHGIKHQAEVSSVLERTLQLDAVTPTQLVCICQLAQNPLLRLQAEYRRHL